MLEDYHTIVIGGGVHATTFGLDVLHPSAKSFAFIDPECRLMERWRRQTAATGMRFMRSSMKYGISPEFPLNIYAKFVDESPPSEILTSDGIRRPSLRLFNRQARYLIDHFGLEQHLIQGTVDNIRKRFWGGYHLETVSGDTVSARNIIVAMGGNKFRVPDDLHFFDYPQVHHVLDADREDTLEYSGRKIAVIGQGISAAHLVNQLARDNDVHVFGNGWKVAELDAFKEYSDTYTLERQFHPLIAVGRNALIRRVSNPGTIPKYLYEELENQPYTQALRQFLFKIDYRGMSVTNPFQVRQYFDLVLLATGFKPEIPEFLDSFAKEHTLPRSWDESMPVIEKSLKWGGENVYVTGALGKYGLGPFAPNVIGAHLAVPPLREALKERRNMSYSSPF